MLRLNERSGHRTLRMSLVALVLASLGSGCILVTDDHGPFVTVADLKVRWSVEGSEEAWICDDLGIDRWVVKVRGVEDLDVWVRCREDFWSTETDLFSVAEGVYLVTVAAVDRNDVKLAAVPLSFDLIDRGAVEVFDIEFRQTDFQ